MDPRVFFPSGAPPPAPAPADHTLAQRILKLAEFAARNGPGFIEEVKAKQYHNPEYAFLHGGEGAAYFFWSLYCQVIGQPAHPQAGIGAPPPSAPPPGHPSSISTAATAALPQDVRSGWSQVLSLLNGTKESITNSQAWFMACAPYTAGMAEMTTAAAAAAADHATALHILWLVNDILFKAKSQRSEGATADSDPIASSFRPLLGRLLQSVYLAAGDNSEKQQAVLRVANIWSERGVYPSMVVESIVMEMMGVGGPALPAKPAVVAGQVHTGARPPPPPPPSMLPPPRQPPAPWAPQQQQQQQQYQPPPPAMPPPLGMHPQAVVQQQHLPWQPHPPPSSLPPGAHPFYPQQQPLHPQHAQQQHSMMHPNPQNPAHAHAHAHPAPHQLPPHAVPMPPPGAQPTMVGNQHHYHPAAHAMRPPQSMPTFPPPPPSSPPPPEPQVPEEPPFDPFSFPPGLIPRLVEDTLRSEAAYSPLSPLDIEKSEVPPPPTMDPYLKARLDKFYAQLADFRPGMAFSDIEVEPARRRQFTDRGSGAAGGHGGSGHGVPSVRPDDGSGGFGPSNAPGGRGLGYGASDTGTEERNDVFSSYRTMRSHGYHAGITRSAGGKSSSHVRR